jgi:predicted RNase H-like nuclease (RuvC/YqgF family)
MPGEQGEIPHAAPSTVTPSGSNRAGGRRDPWIGPLQAAMIEWKRHHNQEEEESMDGTKVIRKKLGNFEGDLKKRVRSLEKDLSNLGKKLEKKEKEVKKLQEKLTSKLVKNVKKKVKNAKKKVTKRLGDIF